MNGPTPPRKVRARSYVDDVDDQVSLALAVLREHLGEIVDGSAVDAAICTVEMSHATAMAIYRKTNPSKIRSEAMTIEIGARLDGKPEIWWPGHGGRVE